MFRLPRNDGCRLPMRRIDGLPSKLRTRKTPRRPSGLLAMAVFFAGPSMAPPNLQAVPPPEYAASEVVAGAVVLAGVVKEPEKAKEKYGVFVQKALALTARMQQPQQQ